MNAEDLVRRAIPIFIRNADYELITLRVGLAAGMLPPAQHERLIAFVPLAFGRTLLDVSVDATGQERMRGKLADERHAEPVNGAMR